jgi:hypothetical protein
MADYDTYSGLDFENAELANELEPKKITEEAILQLINHIKLEYQPDGTVDAASDGPVKGKAVWQALHDAMVQKTEIHTAEITKSHQELYETDTTIDVTRYVYYITEIDDEGKPWKLPAIDVQFVPQLYTVNRWGFPEFQGKTFTLFLSFEEDTSSMSGNLHRNGSMCELTWRRAYGGLVDQSWDHSSIKTFTRRVEFLYNQNDGKYYLTIQPTAAAIYTKIADKVGQWEFNEIVSTQPHPSGATPADVIDNWTPRMKVRKIILSKGLI